MFNKIQKFLAISLGFGLLLFSPIVALAETVSTTVDTSSVQDMVTTEQPITVEAPQETTVIYSTTTCPHCKNVKTFVSVNEVPNVEFRNVDTNATYEEEYKALYAKYSTTETGVPVMEGDGKLISGDTPIIEYLTKKYNITPKEVETKLETNGSDLAFIIIGGIVLTGVIGYGVYSAISKK